MSGFYIGYLPQAPEDLRRFLRRTVSALFAIAAILAVMLVLAQQKFSPAVFEYSTVRDFEGTLVAAPYPALIVNDQASGSSQHLSLVGVGKHGFGESLASFSGKQVRLRAKRIYRDEGLMLEVMPGSITPMVAKASSSHIVPVSSGSIQLTGEIVDTKCFLGVMNPGRSKIHRDCAARCISGGVPPALLVAERSHLYLLAGADGSPLHPRTILDRVAEPVIVRGELWKLGDSYSIYVSEITRR